MVTQNSLENALQPTGLSTRLKPDQYLPKTTIEDLPAEILLIIFKLVFMKSRIGTYRLWPPCSCTYPKLQTPCDCHDKPFKTSWVETEDLQNPHIFPYATSSVCKRWHSLMQLVPIFWTRIVVFVDENPTPLVNLRTSLALSGDLPLDLYVIRRKGTYDQADYRERVRCGSTLIISFDVIHNSSLPSLVYDFRGKANHLVTLQLKCRVDDGRWYTPRPHIRAIKSFYFPNLTTLDVDGRNFADACVLKSTWHKSLRGPKKLNVTISNFRPILNNIHHDCTVGDLAEALASIYDIPMLCLTNVEFGWGIPTFDDEDLDIPVANLTVTDVPRKFLEDFLELIPSELQYLHVTKSSLPYRQPSFYATELILEDILLDEDIPAFLRRWRGMDLDILRCKGFDDRAIEALGIKHPATTANISHERRNFTIHDCPNVSVNALKELITMRHKANTANQEQKCTLAVTGEGSGLSADDRAWFKENLEYFRWNTEQIP